MLAAAEGHVGLIELLLDKGGIYLILQMYPKDHLYILSKFHTLLILLVFSR